MAVPFSLALFTAYALAIPQPWGNWGPTTTCSTSVCPTLSTSACPTLSASSCPTLSTTTFTTYSTTTCPTLSSTACPTPSSTSCSACPTSTSSSSSSNNVWDLKKFDTLVAFGDSYTDDSRLGYFYANGGNPPPTGWYNPPNANSADGGYPWPDWVAWYSGATRYNYAVAGAVCSNNITPRWAGGFYFPDVAGYEVPAFLADKAYTDPNTGDPFFTGDPSSTVYSMWIGTNDLGNNAFLTDSQVAGTNIDTYIDCVYSQLKSLYDSGARYFVLQNVAPLNLAPLYATPQDGGVGSNHYWWDKPGNHTKISYRMMEQVVTTNAVYKYRTPFEVALQQNLPGARFAIMDMHALITNIYTYPGAYLNGSAPANVTGYVNHCNLDNSVCTQQDSPDSFLWYDELHPSQQTDRIIAREFIGVVNGGSQWATYWGT